MIEEFETTFSNKTNERWRVVDAQGIEIDFIEPFQKRTIFITDRFSCYAPFEVIENFGDHVELHQRPDWREPDRGKWVIELLNSDGPPLDSRMVDGSVVFLPRQVPVRVAITRLEEPLIYYRKLEIRRQSGRVKDEQSRGYYRRATFMKDALTERRREELKELEKAMEQAVQEVPGFVPPEMSKEDTPEDLPVFTCVLKNKRQREVKDGQVVKEGIVDVDHDSGVPWLRLAPESQFVVESYDAKTMFAKYSEVIWEKDGTITTKRNSSWKCPPYEYALEYENQQGAPIELVDFRTPSTNLELYRIPKGFSVIVSLGLLDSRVNYQKIVLRTEKYKAQLAPGYMVERIRNVEQRIPRPKKELEKIAAERKRIIEERAARDVAAQAKKAEREIGAVKEE